MLIDSFHRVHNYLRISLTDNCNLRCSYCMPEETYDFTPASRLMQVNEIESIAKAFVNAGVTKIRLTGGEPLVRRDAAEIISRLSALGVELTMTTNATRIHDFIPLLSQVGMHKINVSLDTLKRDIFLFLTKRDLFDVVRDNVNKLLVQGFAVKINVVVMKGVNDAEILDFVRWSVVENVDVRFIEFMPFDGNLWNQSKVVTWQQMLHLIEAEWGTRVQIMPRNKHETVKQYRINGGKGTFAVISTLSAPFCGDCNRLRLTADGKMKNCLFSKGETDLLGALRSGVPIDALIRESVMGKAMALGGQFGGDLEGIDPATIVNRSMITIGG